MSKINFVFRKGSNCERFLHRWNKKNKKLPTGAGTFEGRINPSGCDGGLLTQARRRGSSGSP